ncbi:hypothetical protein AYK24_03135 [Thermoplasmatales archaeon SG8-52-4]|nr:MAG: hypothetical protein AYK24_03135 [Thermoplasmatales archaeon SG8-52-4]
METKIFHKILDEIPTYSRFLKVSEIDNLINLITKFPNVKYEKIGQTVDDESLKMLEIGKNNDKTALIIGVPHSDEPLGSLVITFFSRWLATHPEVDCFGWRWLFIPILERRGMRLNEGWFNIPESLAAMAKSSFREPTEDQYEWTFPIEYEDFKWTQSRPETIAIKEVLEKEKPKLLCNLHHSGFTNGYYYLSKDFPEIYPELSKFADSLRIPLSDKTPDVPFGKMFSPGFYQMYGLKDYLEYYKKKDPLVLPALRRGACSDEWYQKNIGGFSFNCEVPMYLSHKLKDKNPSKRSYKKMIEQRYKRKKSRLEYSIMLIEKLKEYENMADPLFLNLAKKHIANAQLSLEHEKRIIASAEDRVITKAEKFENSVIEDLFDLFFLGQIWRVAESICIKGSAPKVCLLMETSDFEIKSLARQIQEKGAFYQVPIRNSVKMQLGSILIIAEALKNKMKNSIPQNQ